MEPNEDELTDAHLPSDFQGWNLPDSSPRDKRAAPVGSARSPAPTREDILEGLDIFEGNVTLTAKHLGVSRAQLYRLLNSFGIQPKDHR
jgi:transcriptional regulator of acetoin/glycerol metabolism